MYTTDLDAPETESLTLLSGTTYIAVEDDPHRSRAKTLGTLTFGSRGDFAERQAALRLSIV